ncbi:MAG: 4'-phosphopantetheinyl transferase family protein [Janthinobacterium lividum]
MPLHSLQPLPGGAWLGRWHLLEAPTALWPLLADSPAYAPLLPARTAGPRQAQWLAGRVLLQHLLAAAGYPAAPLRNEASGRPFLLGAALGPTVSLSHAGAWVVALLGPPGTAAGLDVEAVRPKAQRIAPKFLTDAEQAASQQVIALGAAPEALYTLLWSAKETLFKLSGRVGIIFRQNLLLDLPPAPWPAAGTLPARLHLAEQQTRHQICYFEPAAGYVLTYCVG